LRRRLTHIKAKLPPLHQSCRQKVLILFDQKHDVMPQEQLAAPIPVIAVIDDDPAVCNSLKFSLELEGFTVRAYRSGAELLAAGDFDDCKCFIVDQRMPGMNGMDVIAELRQRKVSTPAILIISQPNKVLSDRAAAARVPIVEKPLLSNALVEKIREVCATT
jgi:two-component system response regulator FixJ